MINAYGEGRNVVQQVPVVIPDTKGLVRNRQTFSFAFRTLKTEYC
jgi:hypothetical protein